MKGIKLLLFLCTCCISLFVPLIYKSYSLLEILCISFFSLVLVTGATIDMQYFILPDEGAIGLAIIGYLYTVITYHVYIDTCIQVLVVAIMSICLRYISHNGFGWGDVKWLCAISIWFTPVQMIVMIYISVLTACLYLIFMKTINRPIERYIPFGPFLAFGAWQGLHFSMFWEDIYWLIITSI